MKKYWTSGVMIEITREKEGDRLYYRCGDVDSKLDMLSAALAGLDFRDKRIAELESELSVYARDTARLDWLADWDNPHGGVTLPREIVERNLHSMRDAIDEAMTIFPAPGNRSGN